MKAVCPYCEKVFEKKRRNQLYCHTYCRQGDYLLRKSGRKEKDLGAIRSLSVEETYNGQKVENPSTLQSVENNAGTFQSKRVLNVINTTPKRSNSQKARQENPQSVENPYDGQNVENPSKAIQRDAGVKWQIKAKTKQRTTENPAIRPTDDLPQKQSIKADQNKKNKRPKRRSKSVRRFEAPDEYWKRNVIVHTPNNTLKETPANPVPQPLTAPAKPPVQDNYHPVEQIPPQSNHEPLTEYMAKHGLTRIVMPKQFTADLFPHWNDKEKLAFTILNEKVAEALRMLISAQGRIIKIDYLKGVYNKLHELTTGIYRLFMPEDYPLLRFIRLVELKLKPAIERTGPTVEFEYQMDEQFKKQVMFVCLQVENAEY